MSGSVEITLLGRFEVRVDGGPVAADAWRRRDPAALVKLLALAPGRRLHREQVLDALWPDVDPAAAGPRLHKAAHYVRKAIGRADAVELAGETVALLPGADITVDAEAFEALAAGGDDEAALGLYAGDVLPADPYEPWLERDRDRLQQLRLLLLRRTGRWEELLALDPVDEEAHVALMRRELAAGRAGAVLRRYERLERILAEELGVAPSAEAVDLRARAAGRPPAVAPAPVPVAPAPLRPHHRRRTGLRHGCRIQTV